MSIVNEILLMNGRTWYEKHSKKRVDIFKDKMLKRFADWEENIKSFKKDVRLYKLSWTIPTSKVEYSNYIYVPSN